MSQTQTNLEVRRISGHAGTVPGSGLKRDLEVAKLIDTTTCIGCKACEVACMEWNSLTYSDTTAPAGIPSYYRVVVVDTSGNASTPATTSAMTCSTSPRAMRTGGTR